MTTEEPPPPSSTTSPLDKPLHLLTEDDIAQVTREQCRRYLKQKGMRRPSWNKSQAIQQVIMLKALLEPSPDSGGCSRKFHITHRRPETPTMRVQLGTSAVKEVSVLADEPVPVWRNGSDNDFVRWVTDLTNEVKGQMAICYSGKSFQEAQVDVNVTTSSLKLQILSTKPTTDSSHALSNLTNSRRFSKQESISQRYLEKLKDRSRFKIMRKAEGPAIDSLYAYISNQIYNQDQNEHSKAVMVALPHQSDHLTRITG